MRPASTGGGGQAVDNNMASMIHCFGVTCRIHVVHQPYSQPGSPVLMQDGHKFYVPGGRYAELKPYVIPVSQRTRYPGPND